MTVPRQNAQQSHHNDKKNCCMITTLQFPLGSNVIACFFQWVMVCWLAHFKLSLWPKAIPELWLQRLVCLSSLNLFSSPAYRYAFCLAWTQQTLVHSVHWGFQLFTLSVSMLLSKKMKMGRNFWCVCAEGLLSCVIFFLVCGLHLIHPEVMSK